MRKDLRRVNEQSLHEALTILGYTRCGEGEWRRRQFHLFTRKGKRGVTLSIHEDVPCSLPPFHRARHKGKALEEELRKIVNAYQTRRATKK